MMKKINMKGFTLIELLAVIIILAILMTLAITAMSGYITDAKKDTFITTAQQYANATRLSFVNGDYNSIARGNCIAVKTSGIALESGSTESPFGFDYVDDSSYVVISNVSSATDESDKYEYYVQMVDSRGNGFGLLREADVERGNVIQETAKTASVPTGSYQALPSTATGTLKLFQEGDSNNNPSNTCTLSAIY